MTLDAIVWAGDRLQLLDQRRLPHQQIYLEFTAAPAVAEAIADMVVRGAPAIGITAAYGMVLAARQVAAAAVPGVSLDWSTALVPALTALGQSRPTAVNLFWALDKVRAVVAGGGQDIPQQLEQLALAIHRDDIAANRRMGQLGAGLLGEASLVYTHCNAGALATGGYGTALGVIRAGFAAGKLDHVFVGETRPWLQGSRLTAWELAEEGIPHSLVVEGAAGHVMRTHRPDWVIVGADRVAANGDVCNKVGTYNLAILARHHGVKFMAVMPRSTIDMSLPDGACIPIEQRPTEEVTHWQGAAIAPHRSTAVNPAFDITPAALVDAIVTELGVVRSPTAALMAAMFGS